MNRKMFLTAAALVLLFLSASPTRAGEITVNWMQNLDSGMISGIKFMPGEDNFMITNGYELQIRNCENGDIITKYPIGVYKFEFTPDNNKLAMIYNVGGMKTLQTRNITDMSLVSEYKLPLDTGGFYSAFEEIAVDPIRPFIYVIWKKGKDSLGYWVFYRKIQIYDRETLQPVGELTTPEDEKLLLVNLAVSKDGKYLAVMNEGKISKLMVWSLDTRQKIVDKYISDQNTNEWSDPADVKFSKLNTDRIYFTGQFYQDNNNGLFGLCIFSIIQNRIIDSTFATVEDIDDRIYNEGFTFFENETKILGGGGPFVKIVDLISMELEFQRHYQDGDTVYPGNSVYNSIHKFFIGYGTGTINKFNYQPDTGVPENNPKVIIYPNPTTGIVNIPMNCVNTSKYEIFDSSGNLIKSSNLSGVSGNLLTIDFTQYPVGVYSVKVYCGKEVEQYQVVRGE
ncbi:MAG: T9SS type A sorting domain-containing protein [Candidatus Kapabacteria bacterium]|nr:T9SS type A sorting domain-containing protein [Candidatus Kapabacteria bacterium]